MFEGFKDLISSKVKESFLFTKMSESIVPTIWTRLKVKNHNYHN